MSDLNNWNVSGRLTKDAAQKSVGSKGTTLTYFDIANNTGFGNNKKCNFITVNIWGSKGTALLPYLKKGTGVILTGQLDINKWTGQDGLEHSQLQMNANDIVLNGAPVNAQPQPDVIPDMGDKDNIVF